MRWHQHDQRTDGGKEQPVEQAEQQHARTSQQRDAELCARRCAQPLQVVDANKVRCGHQHDRGQHRFAEVMKQRGEEQQCQRDGRGGHDQRQRRRRAAHIVDRGLRHAAGHRKAVGQAGGDIGGAERGEFLLRIDLIAVFLRKAAGDRDGFTVGQQETGKGGRDQLGDVGRMNAGKADAGQAGRQLADDMDAHRAEQRDGDDRRSDHE